MGNLACVQPPWHRVPMGKGLGVELQPGKHVPTMSPPHPCSLTCLLLALGGAEIPAHEAGPRVTKSLLKSPHSSGAAGIAAVLVAWQCSSGLF